MSSLSIRDERVDKINVFSRNTNVKEAEKDIVHSLITDNVDFDNEYVKNGGGDGLWDKLSVNSDDINNMVPFVFPSNVITQKACYLFEAVERSGGQSEEDQEYSYQLSPDLQQIIKKNKSGSAYYTSSVYCQFSNIDDIYDKVTSDGYTRDPTATMKINFDKNDSNYKLQYAMHSKWNTATVQTGAFYNKLKTVGPNPLTIRQDTNFNYFGVFGLHGFSHPYGNLRNQLLSVANINTFNTSFDNYISKYAFTNSGNGDLGFINFPDTHQPKINNLNVKVSNNTDMENFDIKQTGFFRFQQKSPDIVISATGNNNVIDINNNRLHFPLNIMNSNDYNNLPSNYNKNNYLLFNTLNEDNFFNLFNENISNIITDGYKLEFKIESDGAGYTIQERTTKYNNTPIIEAINNDNILDDVYYIKNYVNRNHKIILSSSGLNISAATDGLESTKDLLVINAEYGEKLNEFNSSSTGEMIIQSESWDKRTIDITVTKNSTPVLNNIKTYVYYSNDKDLPLNQKTINLDANQLTNKYFDCSFRKVASSSTISDSSQFITSNNAALSLCSSTSIVNSSYNKSDFSFNFNKENINNDVSLFKIKINNKFDMNENGFYKDESCVTTNFQENFSVTGNLNNLIDVEAFENISNYINHRLTLEPKLGSDIGLSQALPSNWFLSFTGSESYLTSNSTTAFRDIYKDYITNVSNNLKKLSFMYEYKTQTSSNKFGQLTDFVLLKLCETDKNVTPTFNEPNVKTIKIDQQYLKKTISGTPTINKVDVDSNKYTLKDNLDKTRYKLVKITTVTYFDVSLDPFFSIFDNINLTIKGIQQINKFYSIIDNVTNKPVRNYLQSVEITDPTFTDDINMFDEVLSVTNGSLNFTGQFLKDDFRPYYGIVESQKVDNKWYNLTNKISVDCYYGIDNILNIAGGNSANDPDITFTSSYTPTVESSLNNINNDTKLNLSKYFIPFVISKKNNNFTLSSFTSSVSDLGIKTNISNTNSNILDINNLYSSTNNSYWSSSDYVLSVLEDINVYKLTVKKSNLIIFEISIKKNIVFLGTFLISHIFNDIWSVTKRLGESSITNTVTANFEKIVYDNYKFTSNTIPGIVIDGFDRFFDNNTNITFNVLADKIDVNLIGPAGNPELIDTLEYSYSDSASGQYSAKALIPFFRGFPIGNNTKQYYNINRSKLNAKFSVTGDIADNNLEQTFSNVFLNKVCEVNNLTNTSQAINVNLGIKFTILYSILPTNINSNSIISYDISIKSDKVTCIISNPNCISDIYNLTVPAPSTSMGTDIKSVTINTLLNKNTFDNIFTFSGINLDKILSTRIKLKNANFPYETFTYSINYSTKPLSVYRAISNTDIGNPVLFNNTSINNEPDPTKWEKIRTLTSYQEKINGINIGLLKISQNNNKREKSNISFVCSLLPRMIYTCISVLENPVIPYDYNNTYINSRIQKYHAYTGDSNVQPFRTSDIQDLNGNVLKYYVGDSKSLSSEAKANNITVTYLNPTPLKNLYLNHDTNVTEFVIPGSYVKILYDSAVYDGGPLNQFYPSDNSKKLLYSIYEGLITKITDVRDIAIVNNAIENDHKVVIKERDSFGRTMLGIRQFVTDVGASANNASTYTSFLSPSVDSWYNIAIQIDNVHFFESIDSIVPIVFNNFSDGVRCTLYTVIEIHNNTLSKNYKRINKYTSNEIVSLAPNPVIKFSFNSLSYVNILAKTPVFDNNGRIDYGSFFDNLDLNQIMIDNGKEINWINDETFSDFVFSGWIFSNQRVAEYIIKNYISVRSSIKNWVHMNLLPFYSFKNQLGIKVAEISFNGTMTTPCLATQFMVLSPEPKVGDINQVSTDDILRITSSIIE